MKAKRSLTWVLFALLTLGGFLVVAANRFSATYLMQVDVQSRIQQQMRDGITTCLPLLAQKEHFLTCYREFNAAEASRVLSDQFLFCDVGTQSIDKPSVEICQGVDERDVNWIPNHADLDWFSGFHFSLLMFPAPATRRSNNPRARARTGPPLEREGD